MQNSLPAAGAPNTEPIPGAAVVVLGKGKAGWPLALVVVVRAAVLVAAAVVVVAAPKPKLSDDAVTGAVVVGCAAADRPKLKPVAACAGLVVPKEIADAAVDFGSSVVLDTPNWTEIPVLVLSIA